MATGSSGPRIMPAAGRQARALVLLLHGYGASGDDLLALAESWRPLLPDVAFVAPHAPEPLPGMMMAGFQWFGLESLDPPALARGAARAWPGLESRIGAELGSLALPASRLVLAGFSQGAMMALHAGLRLAPTVAGVLAYSGVLAANAPPGPEAPARPPVMLVHGEADEVIPVDALVLTRTTLAAAGAPVEWHIRPRLGHGIDEEGLRIGAEFITLALSNTGKA